MLPRAVLAAVQIPYAAAGLDALSRELSVQPLCIALQHTKVISVHRKVTTGDCAKRAIDERGKVNCPTLPLQVSLDAVVLGALLHSHARESRASSIGACLFFKRYSQIHYRNRLLAVVVQL